MKYEDDFLRIRELLPELHKRIQRQLPPKYMTAAGRDLGLLKNKTFIFENETETAVFSDYLLYSYQPHGLSMVRRYLNLNRGQLDAFSVALLEAMTASRYSLYAVKEIVSGKGAMVADLLRKESYFLGDRNLSRSEDPLDMVIAMRLIFFDDFAIQSGGAIPVERDLLDIPEFVHLMAKLVPKPLLGDFLHLTPAQEAKFAQGVMSICLRKGYTDYIVYE